ncbi:RHS domain-containing protein [Acinetobacter guillouiae]|uniref:RHS repeat-associated core domain-containing protein n=1 Tax=Acinetobacter guillouiae TaxID=106649 RepID=UPI0021D36A02|nr:RHS repeat-associated core domain-containing protein [Acinetobacter guillouiae]MCU4491830.1 RHS domain-containing protein [Acinetobacter guillouiae]
MATPAKPAPKPQVKASTRTNTGQKAVTPLNKMNFADVKAATAKIDKWLLAHTGNYVSLSTLKNVASAVPVVGNIFAVVDVAYDVVDISKKPSPVFFDWVNLGLDLVGVVPIPPNMAAMRMSMRPGLNLVLQNVKQGVKHEIADTIIVILSDHLNEQIAGELDQFAAKAQPLIKDMLQKCGNKVSEISNSFTTGFTKILNGQVFSSAGNIKQAQKSLSKVSLNGFVRDSSKTLDNLWDGVKNVAKAGTKEYLNTGAKVVSAVVPASAKQPILVVIGDIRKFGQKAPQYLMVLADPAKAMSIAWLLNTLLQAVKKFKLKKKATANIKPNQVTEKQKKRPSGELEKINVQAKANANPTTKVPKCANLAGKGAQSTKASKTSKSITFALGTENVSHTDAFVSAIENFVLHRTYASNLYQLDQGEFGARWITYFTTRIVPQSEYIEETEEQAGHFNQLDGLEFIGDDGRPIKLPKLKVGDSFHNQTEDFYYTVVSDNVQMISYHKEEKHLFEKYKDGYRLATIEYKNGITLAVRYDHQFEDQSFISDVIIKEKSKQLVHVAFQVNTSGRVEDAWLVENGQLARPLASYNYNDQGDLIEAITENGASFHYQYDHHLLTRYTDLTGRGMNLEYDGIEPTSKAYHEWADDGSSETKLQWDENIRLTYVTDAYGAETWYYYDIDGYTYRIVYPDGLEEWFFRDDFARVVKHVDTDAAVTIYDYDENGNLISMTQPDGSVLHYAYDENRQLTGMVDAEQGRWFKEYDASGNISKETDPLKRVTEYSYNGLGLLTSIKDAKGGSKSLKYDDQGNLISYTDCSGKETKWEYDDKGRVTVVENALGQKVEYFYSDLTTEQREPIIKGLPLNAFGKLEKIKHADGAEEHFIHDAEGRLLAHVDPKQQVTQYEYDAAGLIASRTDALNHKLKYQWDKLNRLKRLTNENGASYEFFYDVASRLFKEIDFDGKEIIYKYDETDGNLSSSIEVASSYGQELKDRLAPKDRIQQFLFDSMGRLEQRTAGYGHIAQDLEQKLIEEFAYDSNGNLIQAKNSDSNLQWYYDAVGNVIREHHQDYKTNQTAVWKHSYDEIDDRIKTIRPDGQNIDWLTYGTGHVHSLILNGQDVVSFERDDLHREKVRHYANGISQEQHYDEMGRLTQQSIVNGHEFGYPSQQSQTHNNAIEETQQLIQRLYQYDKTGQLTGIQDTRRGNINYKYDPVGRLLEANSKLGKETFNFDPASNIIDRYNTTKEQSYQQTAEEKGYGYNRLVNNVVKEYLDQQYQYDAYGQLIRQKSTKGDLHLEWDVCGRLIKSRNAEYTAEYRYDALGRRIQKRSKHHHTGDEQNVIYGWEGNTLAYESNDQITKHYVYEKGSFVPLVQAVYAERIELHQTPDWSDKPYSLQRDPLWKTNKKVKDWNDVWFYHCDHLGTPQEMSDSSGQVIWKAEYKAWGECKSEKAKSNFFENSEIISNNIRFQGQYFDQETGLHYNRYRYYSPYVGRFISKDPIGLLGGHNVYAYAPNPVGWIDPLGLNKNCPPTLYRTMKPEDGKFKDSPLDGAPNSNQKGARTASSNPKHNDFEGITSANDMVGPSHTGKQGLSSSLEELPTRTGQVNGKVDASTLPKGLGYENDHGKHVSIYPAKDMTFGEYQKLLNSIDWK